MYHVYMNTSILNKKDKQLCVELNNKQLSALKTGKFKTTNYPAKIYYGHTHGIYCTHHSGNCDEPKGGHNKHATKDKKMGGCATKYKAK